MGNCGEKALSGPSVCCEWVTVERKHYLVPVCTVNGVTGEKGLSVCCEWVTVERKHYLVPVCTVNGCNCGEKALSGPSEYCEWV